MESLNLNSFLNDILPLLGSFLSSIPCESKFSLAMEGFASLEAKRNFRAPRMSPPIVNQSTLISSSASFLEHKTLEASASETKNSGASTVDTENCGSGPLPNHDVSCLN